MDLTYGPVGDPNSRDPFEYAQAHAPDGWHVEGQVFRDGGECLMLAKHRDTKPFRDGNYWGGYARGAGKTPMLAAVDLVRSMNDR
jgi:hypothetical protein